MSTTIARGLTGVFAVNKPSGLTSTTILDHLQHVCRMNRKTDLVREVLSLDASKRAQRGLVKIGHGGTLDPLARGVVVVGMGSGCKELGQMTGSTKTYIAEATLGYSSTTLDIQGSLIATGPTNHITTSLIQESLESFRGPITQTPPLYSALSMDGKRLYDYARENKPLPREIPSRTVTIYDLELLSASFKENEQHEGYLASTPQAIKALQILESSKGSKENMVNPTNTSTPMFKKSGFIPKSLTNPKLDPKFVPIPMEAYEPQQSLKFSILVHCSSGTYIRSLIADIAQKLGTVGLMSDLLRTSQAGYELNHLATLEMADCEDLDKVSRALEEGNKILKMQKVLWQTARAEGVEY